VADRAGGRHPRSLLVVGGRDGRLAAFGRRTDRPGPGAARSLAAEPGNLIVIRPQDSSFPKCCHTRPPGEKERGERAGRATTSPPARAGPVSDWSPTTGPGRARRRLLGQERTE